MREGKQVNKKTMDSAVEEYIRGNLDGSEIVTGWMLSVSVRHPAMENSDGYIVENSEGLPYHSQLGLLTAALDEKRNTILSQTLKE